MGLTSKPVCTTEDAVLMALVTASAILEAQSGVPSFKKACVLVDQCLEEVAARVEEHFAQMAAAQEEGS